MSTQDSAIRRFDGRSLQSVPPLFAGGAQLAIIMTTAVWGSLSFADIKRLLNGRTKAHLGAAARALERLNVCVVSGRRPTVHVRLDDRHPMAEQIRQLGRKLYRAYIMPLQGDVPFSAKTIEGKSKHRKYPIKSIDLHIMGKRPLARLLHLIAEVDEIPAFMIIRLLGFSIGMYKQINSLQKLGILETRRKGVDLYVKMNRKWFGYGELRTLLRTLNKHLPTYKALAEIHRERRRQHCYIWSVRLRRTRIYKAKQLLKQATARNKRRNSTDK